MTRYRTIVADPPWAYQEGWPAVSTSEKALYRARGVAPRRPRTQLPFPPMTVEEIQRLSVESLASSDAHLYLWTTNRYLPDAFDVVKAWGFRYSQTLTWCKAPMGLGPGATYANTTEFVLVGKRGALAPTERHDTSWFQWPRTARHSRKPEAFLDLVEQVSPGPYLEMFARRARMGWDYWGDQSLGTAEVA